MNTITDLKGALGQGVRTSKFQVVINKPSSVGMLDGDQYVSSKQIPFLAQATSLPEKSISSAHVMHRGRKYPIRDIAQFNDTWSCTFYNDSSFKIRKFFEDWMYDIDRYDNLLTQDSFIMNDEIPLGYMQDVKIIQYDACGNSIASYTLYHAWPSRLHDIQLNTEEQNMISKTTVDFTYSYWKRDDQLFTPITNVVSGVSNELNNILKIFR